MIVYEQRFVGLLAYAAAKFSQVVSLGDIAQRPGVGMILIGNRTEREIPIGAGFA